MASAVAGAKADAAPAMAATADGKQHAPSAVSTASRLKYADPRSLPSFPSSGLASGGAAASAAATLGWSNQKTVDAWKPERTPAASSAAALFAADYKMAPAWQPAANPDGHKAALLAVGSAGAALKQSSTTAKPSASHSQQAWGNSAATQAFHAKRPISAGPPSLGPGSSAATQAFSVSRPRSLSANKADSGGKSLVAAKGAMSVHRASYSHPSVGVRDAHAAEASRASSALDGATRAHRASMQSRLSGGAGAVPVTTMTRSMFTANPPVKPEVDERNYNERLHQSAVDMAKKMYRQQQKMVEQTKIAHADHAASGTQPAPYLNLQDAAYKQAQERLAKLHDEHQQRRAYQEYYGGSDRSRRHRFSVASRLGRRSSEGDDFDDRQRSQKIREQMSLFSSKLSEVDKEKREKDREALMAAAQRNVKARLQGMDEKVYQDTGRVTPAMLSAWEVKAQQAAQSRHDARVEDKGKIDIGGGKFMTSDEVNAIASKRMQPVLDDINTRADAERERQAVLKMEEEARREEAEKQRTREREIKELNKRVKEQDKQEEKAKKLQERQEEKARREEEKAAKAEEKRLAREEKRKSRLEGAHEHGGGVGTGQDAVRDEGAHDASLSGVGPTVDTQTEPAGAGKRKSESSTSPTSKVKGWIKNRFSRGKSFSEQGEKRRSFFGGAALKGLDRKSSTGSLGNRPRSMQDAIMAGSYGKGHGEAPMTGAAEREPQRDSQGVSPVSTPLEEEERQLGDKADADDEARHSRKPNLEPPRPIGDPAGRTSSSHSRDSRFLEMMER